MPKKVNKVGRRYFKLTVIKYIGKDNYRSIYLCKCDCGKEVEVMGSHLTHTNNNATKSCGCSKGTYEGKEANYFRLYGKVRGGANGRNLEWRLEYKDFRQLVKLPCYYCGGLHSNTLTHRDDIRYTIKYNGIDRVDNTKGYVINNCVPCCQHCNKAKLTMPQSEFFNWLKRAYIYSVKVGNIKP